MKKEEIMFLVKEFMDTQTAMEVRDVLDWVLKKETEAMAQPVEKAQRQEPVETIRDNHLLFHERQQELRKKALELACHLYNTPYYNQSQRDIVGVAQLFYTYITKGE